MNLPDDGKNEDTSSVEDKPAGEERSSTDDTWKSEGGKDSEDSPDDDLLGFESEDVFLKTADNPNCRKRIRVAAQQEATPKKLKSIRINPVMGVFHGKQPMGTKKAKKVRKEQAKKQDAQPEELCTEYKCDAYIFRCHPHYRNSGPWYDWVRFTMDDGTTKLDYPCSVVGIIPMEANGLEETELMVQACLDRTQVHQDQDSVLFQEWEIDHDTYYFIPASSIVKPAFVIGWRPK